MYCLKFYNKTNLFWKKVIVKSHSKIKNIIILLPKLVMIFFINTVSVNILLLKFHIIYQTDKKSLHK